jgi:hypothetical protein
MRDEDLYAYLSNLDILSLKKGWLDLFGKEIFKTPLFGDGLKSIESE